MVIERWREIESLFHAALEKSAADRARFLDESCGSDHALRSEVESLIGHVDLASGFLESDASRPPAPAARESVPPGERIGPYSVIEFLGAGGMGEVYKGRDTRLDRHVAMKFLPRVMADDSSRLERFKREACAASALNHPNICTVYDVGEFRGRSFIVMELLEGQSLKDRISGTPLPLSEVSSISWQLCAGLEAAHATGMVHRDIKPANIFVTGGGQVKMLDFGLAKRAADALSGARATLGQAASTRTLSLTATGTIMGTLAYMSPEQALGEDVDARSDIFSLGVVLYEMTTGKLPFRGRTAAGIMGSILSESPVKPSALNPAVPSRLDRLILKTLEKDRELRYPSVTRLAADLDEWRRSETAAPVVTRRAVLWAASAAAGSIAAGAFLAKRWMLRPESGIRIAVLPFENVGSDPREAFFANGLHQDMISVINRLYPDRIAVIARASVKRYGAASASIRQVGSDLKVDYVLEGGVQRDGGRAHVTARLIRVSDEALLWNETYDRDLDQIVAVQSEIARAIAQGIERRLQPDARVSAALGRPLNTRAHEAYLRGDYLKATELDPGYAPAFSGLAFDAYYPGLFGFEPPREAFTKVVNAAARALELDPTQAGAHASLALGKLHLHWSWAEAEAGLRRALRLDPANGDARHFFGHFLLWAGQSDEAVRESRRGLEVDPYNPDLISCIGWHELCAGHPDKALEESRRALALDPNHGWALLTLGWTYELKGMFQEALSALRSSFNSTLKTASIAHVSARSGDRRKAEAILSDLLAESNRKYVSPYDIAVIYTGLDNTERAFAWLARAAEEHSGFLLFVNSDPRFENLRTDPRFHRLLRQMQNPNSRA